MVQQEIVQKRHDPLEIKHARLYLALSVLLGVCGLVWSACTASMGYGLLLPLLLFILPALVFLVLALSSFPALYFDNRIRNEFRKCCLGAGLGTKFETHGVPEWKYYRFIDLFRADGFHHRDNVPSLRGLSGNFERWTARILPLYGQEVDDFTKQAQAFALAHNVSFVSFERGKSGGIVIRAGRALVPEVAGYHESPVVSADGLELVRPLDVLRAVPVAYTLDDERYTMPIVGQHVLIAGRTGAGKGSWVWSIILGLAPAYNAGYVRFWGCDPKRLELAIGKYWFAEYADLVEDIVPMLERAVEDMMARAKSLQGVARNFTPSVDTPLNIIVVDELGYLAAMVPDKKLRERAEKAITTILALGRAVGYSVVGAVQDPRKETVGFRDLFPVRVALGMPKPMVDLVLGDGMYEVGARADQIPLGELGAGTGYVVSEDTMQPVQVRAPWCGDDAIQSVWIDVAVGKRQARQAAIEAHEVPQLDFGYNPNMQQFR